MTIDASTHPAAGWLLWSAVACNLAWTAAAVAFVALAVYAHRRLVREDRADRGEDEPWRESLRNDDDLAGAGRP